LKKIVSEYQTQEKTATWKYEELERFYLVNEMVESGLESLQIVNSQADEFSKVMQETEESFELKFSAELVERHRNDLVETAATQFAESLDTVGGTVLLTGTFQITTSEDNVELDFIHPASQKLQAPSEILFNVTLPWAALEPRSIEMLEDMDEISLRVFGDFYRSTRTTTPLYKYKLVPVAVYRGR